MGLVLASGIFRKRDYDRVFAKYHGMFQHGGREEHGSLFEYFDFGGAFGAYFSPAILDFTTDDIGVMPVRLVIVVGADAACGRGQNGRMGEFFCEEVEDRPIRINKWLINRH